MLEVVFFVFQLEIVHNLTQNFKQETVTWLIKRFLAYSRIEAKIVYSRTGSHSPAFAFTSIFRLLAFYLSSLLPQYDQYCFNPIESSIRRQLKLLDLVFVVYVQDHDNLLSFQSHTKSKLHSLQQIQIVVGQFFLHVKSTKRMTGPTVIPERYVRISMQRNVFKHLWIYFFSVPENQWMDYDCY